MTVAPAQTASWMAACPTAPVLLGRQAREPPAERCVELGVGALTGTRGRAVVLGRPAARARDVPREAGDGVGPSLRGAHRVDRTVRETVVGEHVDR